MPSLVQPCDFMVDSKNAYHKHMYEEHIDPQMTLRCPVESCSELVRKTNLPNHQAQQHQLDNFFCATDDCAETYPTSSDLLNHIRSDHEQLDCRFAGCEVSLKDYTQFKYHVAAHLDPELPWLEDPIFNEHYLSQSDLYGAGLLGGMNDCSNYPAYQQNEGHQSIQYYEPNFTYPAAYRTTSASIHQHTAAVPTFPTLGPQNTFADQVQTAGREPHPPHQSPLDPGNKSYCANLADFTNSGDAVTTPSSDSGTHTSGHICKWIVNFNTNVLCSQAFDTTKGLQEHLRRDHCTPGNASRSIPKAPAICMWKGCSRNGEPLTDVHKLIRHALTHSDYRDFTCSYCGKQCTTKGQLVIHERVHTGEKPIKCEVCSKTTSNESQMAIHRRTHTGEKPHACDICNFRCADSTNLIKHRKKHTLVRHMKVHAKS
ncbi:MAG: hypothetical protein L6R40_001187 [Gallowayella cf. fulva]|nr:MAG: hypothetical protein L6R40_001187 [Xanthomendoza cf. fulva]